MKEILKNRDKLRLGGEKKTLTVMFCDMVGFTKLSEPLVILPAERIGSQSMSLPTSTAVMLRPISSTPPSGMMRREDATPRGYLRPRSVLAAARRQERAEVRTPARSRPARMCATSLSVGSTMLYMPSPGPTVTHSSSEIEPQREFTGPFQES